MQEQCRKSAVAETISTSHTLHKTLLGEAK